MATLHGNEQKINDAVLWKEIPDSDMQKAKREAFLQQLMDLDSSAKTNERYKKLHTIFTKPPQVEIGTSL